MGRFDAVRDEWGDFGIEEGDGGIEGREEKVQEGEGTLL